MKVVINTCFGGFGVSNKVIDFIAKRKNYGIVSNTGVGATTYNFFNKNTKYGSIEIFDEKIHNYDNIIYVNDLERNDKDLIDAIEEIGAKSNTRFSSLKIVEIPDNIEWEISEYDGVESIDEKHRSWN